MSTWSEAWEYMIGLPPGAPQGVIAVLALICIYGFVILPSSALVAYLERKFSADLQARVGPNRTGPFGILQPIADLLKLLQKESRVKRNWRESLWLGVHTMALYSTVAVLPLGSLVLLIDTDMSAFLPFWAALVLALGAMLMGLNQDAVPGWFGGIRIASQALAGAFPAIITIMTVAVTTGGYKWTLISQSQGASPLHWIAFSNPFQFLAFIVFVASGMVLLGIPPLDAGLSAPDIHGGVATHLYGRRLSLFRLGRFYGFFLWSVIGVVLFLGAWNLPVALLDLLKESGSWRLLQILELLVILSKTFGLMLLVIWVARVNPRIRADQVTDLAWKVLSPFSLAALTGAALWSGWMAMS